MKDKLTQKELMFSIVYASTGNASEAARLAGYAEANAGKQGFALLQKNRIKREVKKRSDDFLQASGITKSSVLSDLINLYNQAIKTEALGVARDCLKLLGQHVNLWNDNKTVQHQHQHQLSFEKMLHNLNDPKVIESEEKPMITIN